MQTVKTKLLIKKRKIKMVDKQYCLNRHKINLLSMDATCKFDVFLHDEHSFGMMVTLLAWMAHKLVSSKSPTK